jgi:hypothetical protein
MRATVLETTTSVDGVSCKHTLIERFHKFLRATVSAVLHTAGERTFANGGNMLSGDVTTKDPVLERRILARIRIDLHRLEESLDPTKLSGTANLLPVDVIKSTAAGDGFPECDSWLTDNAADTVFSLHPYST